jgi:N-acetylglucosamine kinase-like BadF-type ATPase
MWHPALWFCDTLHAMKAARLFLGVDGGQSSTTALIADENGAILGAGTAGPCNHVGAGEGAAKLKSAVLECVRQACEQGGFDPGAVVFEAACFGMSGGPADKQTLLAEILRVGRLVVTDDAVIALAGALAGEPGIVVIAGTGSIAFGRNAQDRFARAGGWGYVFGDEGGAFDIVRQALRAALRYEEGWGPATLLKDVLLERSGYASANALLHAFYTADWPRSRVAGMAPLIGSLAQAGDALAIEILEHAAQQLASLALAVRSRLWNAEDTVRFSFIGGVFRGPLLRDRFRSIIELTPGSQTAPPLLGPATGALLEAYRAAGISPDLDKLVTSSF